MTSGGVVFSSGGNFAGNGGSGGKVDFPRRRRAPLGRHGIGPVAPAKLRMGYCCSPIVPSWMKRAPVGWCSIGGCMYTAPPGAIAIMGGDTDVPDAPSSPEVSSSAADGR